CVLGPGLREFDVALLERVATLLVVGNDGVANIPLGLVEGMHPVPREVSPEGQAASADADVLRLRDHYASRSCIRGEGLQPCDSRPESCNSQARWSGDRPLKS